MTLRVMHVISSLGAGGAERSLGEMLPMMRDRGIDSLVVCLLRREHGVHEVVERQGFDVRVVGASRWKASPRIRRIINGWRPDIVHTTIFEADVLGRIAAAGYPCKVVTSLVNTYDGMRVADPTVARQKEAAARFVDGLTARRLNDHFHAISPAVRDSAVSRLRIDPSRITVVPRGRDRSRLGEPSLARRAAVRQSLGLPPSAEVVLNIGRQEPQKGQSVLIEALAMLAPSRPDLFLLQAGREGKSSAQLRKLASELGVLHKIRFLGFRDDVGDLLAGADVFAFPSFYEGLGGSVLEAMAMNVPVVVTDIPALVDVVESHRGGCVVPVGDPRALAKAVDRLLRDRRAATAIAARARRIFVDRFTLDRSVDGMVGMYYSVIHGRSC